ncbi:hypothetical protein ANANG_G00204140 [Anguilla anguilla]|uniref:Uncharacterized protein n=1 Tax=Anguilla anguilla TaxID=7936 RepID=A0A9D3LYI0_ANGAN|nr:hypothetical protein ANANG_G00204140 [Anguilla anguilla]
MDSLLIAGCPGTCINLSWGVVTARCRGEVQRHAREEGGRLSCRRTQSECLRCKEESEETMGSREEAFCLSGWMCLRVLCISFIHLMQIKCRPVSSIHLLS